MFSKNIKVKIHANILLPVVLYGCEPWSVTLREEHQLKVFENRVVTKICGLQTEEVKEEWRKLHIEELRDMYYSPNIMPVIKSRRIRWVGHVARLGLRRDA